LLLKLCFLLNLDEFIETLEDIKTLDEHQQAIFAAYFYQKYCIKF